MCSYARISAAAAVLIFSLVGVSVSVPTDSTKPLGSTRAPDTTVFVHTSSSSERPLALSTSAFSASTKKNAETSMPPSTETPVVLSKIESTTAKVESATRVLPKLGTVSPTKGSQKLNAVVESQQNAGKKLGGGSSGRPPARAPGLDAVDCEVPVLPRESRLWRGNETHELNLPLTISEECTNAVGSEDDCPPEVVSWEASADIQSGDILIVRIADAQLLTTSGNNVTGGNNSQHDDRSHHAPQPAVYMVTRSGHEHCDTSDGMLLDMTPLEERGVKLITLYDKDLIEGVNLFIVVSENWGHQCVRLKVTVKSDNCGESQDCSGKGVCYTNVSMEGYECQCCPGYSGAHCDERDACDPSPCLNNGICVDISQPVNGLNYHCLCPYGFTGRKCEKDPCFSAPCLNGGSCMSMAVNGSTAFHCACAEGWGGARCEAVAVAGACAGRPCVHGICVQNDGDDAYQCFCQPGYTGERCELEYNECESSPCSNGGTCNDRVGGYACACGRGYTGNRCQLKVDLCSPNPCPAHRYCIDRGNTFGCECPRGYVGDDCSMPARAACDNNPCAHGGTCWTGEDSFYCSCPPGYTGRLCEEDFILESVVGSDSLERSEGGTGAGGGGGGAVREMRLSLGLYHDRLHNVYIAAGTLGAAIAIVAAVVTACHCRMNKTYSRLLSRLSGRGAAPAHWLQAARPPRAAPAAAAPAPPADMYYTLDFSDSQSSPLIQ